MPASSTGLEFGADMSDTGCIKAKQARVSAGSSAQTAPQAPQDAPKTRLGLKQAIDFIERKVLFIDLAAVIRIDVALKHLLEKFILIHPNEAAVYGVE